MVKTFYIEVNKNEMRIKGGEVEGGGDFSNA